MSYETKFTKGPWNAIQNGFFKSAVVDQKGNYLSYRTGKEYEKGEVLEANAALIAAAPDLYAALDLLVTKLAETSYGQSPDVAVAKAALEKVRIIEFTM